MPLDTNEINRRTYQQIAAKYAELSLQMPVMVAHQADRLVEGLIQGGRVLDLGCGPGRDLAYFRSQGAKVTGADLTLAMLEQSRQKVGVPLCQMDLRRLGFADGAFAAVWCSAAMLHLPKNELPAALREIWRVLEPAGRLFCSFQQGSGEEIETSPVLDNLPRFFARYTPDELAGILKNAGFQILWQDTEEDSNRPGKIWLWFQSQKPAAGS